MVFCVSDGEGQVSLTFAWDPHKAASNLRKHKLSFEEAATVFDDPMSATVADPDHSGEEDRFLIVGITMHGKPVIVSFTERNGNIRLISARPLTAREREQYEEIKS